jgi:hypothetical protein
MVASYRSQTEAVGLGVRVATGAQVCSLCGQPLTVGDCTVRLTWWKQSASGGAPVADPGPAHLPCLLRDLRYWVRVEVAPPRLSPESVAKKLKRCRAEWDLFMPNERNALNNFQHLVESGRELTPRQQTWLIQMAAKAKAAAAQRKKSNKKAPGQV